MAANSDNTGGTGALFSDLDRTGAYADRYESIVRAKSRSYWVQRQSGLTPLDGFLLDLIAVADAGGPGVEVDELAESAQVPPPIVRRHVVRLVQDGWLEVSPEKGRHRLCTTDKTQNALSAMMMMLVEH